MKPAPFDYLRADDEEEALDALAEAGEDAQLLAGGQTLMPLLNMRLVEPAVLIDISRLSAARGDRRRRRRRRGAARRRLRRASKPGPRSPSARLYSPRRCP